MDDLNDKHCEACSGDTPAITGDAAERYLGQVSDHWRIDESSRLVGTFEFKNYYRTQAFVNAVAYIAHREDHHPEITFGYKQCTVVYITHAIDALSENDFICAARVDALLS